MFLSSEGFIKRISLAPFFIFLFYMGLTVMIQLATVQLSNVHFTKVQCVLQGDG